MRGEKTGSTSCSPRSPGRLPLLPARSPPWGRSQRGRPAAGCPRSCGTPACEGPRAAGAPEELRGPGRCFLHASTQGGLGSGQRPPDSACARARVRVCACAGACACSSSPLGGALSASQAPGPSGPAASTAEARGQRRLGSGGARRTVFLVRPPLSPNTLSTTDV